MPNTVSTLDLFQGIVQSGLVVSGNSYMTVAKSIQSGDALTSFRVSGNTDMIAFRLSRGQGTPLTGGFFNEVEETVTCMVYTRGLYANTSSPVTVVQQRVSDLKVTVASGNWTQSGVPPPQYVSETRPYMQEKFARSDVIYRVRYLL